MLSSSPSSKIHLIVPSGNLKIKVKNLHNFLCAVWEMLLNLLVCKFKYLQSIRKRRLRSFRLCKVVHNFLIWKSLLDIIISEVDDHVTVRMGLSPDSIRENYFFLAWLVNSLDLAIMTNLLLYYLAVSSCLAVVLRQKLKTVVFLLLLITSVIKMINFMILGVVLDYFRLNFNLTRLRSLLFNYSGRLLLILLICV